METEGIRRREAEEKEQEHMVIVSSSFPQTCGGNKSAARVHTKLHSGPTLRSHHLHQQPDHQPSQNKARVRSPPVCSPLTMQRLLSNQENRVTSTSSKRMAKILLVEDIETNRLLARRLARMLGLEMEVAEDGQKAVEYFKGGGTCDLVLMDKDMPIMDGHEATRQLRSLGVRTPIVALSADDLQSDRELFLQAGADEFQTKPLSEKQLVQVLAKYGLCSI